MNNSRNQKNGVAGKLLASVCRIVEQCDRNGATLDDAVESLPDDCRRMAEHLLFTFFRQRKVAEGLLKKFISRPPDPEVMTLLAVTAVQCKFQTGIAPESAVNVAVDAARKFHADKFVNAVMRNFLRAEYPVAPAACDVLPSAVFRRWKKRFDRATLDRMAQLFVSEPEFSYRILPGFDAVPGSVELPAYGNFRFASAPADAVLNSKALKAGGYYIQDPATSLAVSLAAADAPRARRVLDLCAAPGGKTLMLGELCSPDARIVAADISSRRQERTRENFVLRSRSYEVITASPENLYGQYDIILADMPCSNTGVFRKRPDALWRFNERTIKDICEIQRTIAAGALKLLAPGGIIIFSTCSIEPDENQALIDHLCEQYPDLVCEESQLLLPDTTHDGAFAARLRA
ncbi:MAG: RsmB/NOP family class I SAM-dependent RNA methyltransferase [Lentisphaeria bacterium]|nr:RsmB/NOP family class I SAM-dependent RNA methyltransferase [Lentisphaeria bacterium]